MSARHSRAVSNTKYDPLTLYEWNVCKELCDLLEPCAKVTTNIHFLSMYTTLDLKHHYVCLSVKRLETINKCMTIYIVRKW